MKKLLCVLLIALTLAPLAACGREKDKGAATADSADKQAPEASVSQKQPSEKKSESKPADSESSAVSLLTASAGRSTVSSPIFALPLTTGWVAAT